MAWQNQFYIYTYIFTIDFLKNAVCPGSLLLHKLHTSYIFEKIKNNKCQYNENNIQFNNCYILSLGILQTII